MTNLVAGCDDKRVDNEHWRWSSGRIEANPILLNHHNNNGLFQHTRHCKEQGRYKDLGFIRERTYKNEGKIMDTSKLFTEIPINWKKGWRSKGKVNCDRKPTVHDSFQGELLWRRKGNPNILEESCPDYFIGENVRGMFHGCENNKQNKSNSAHNASTQPSRTKQRRAKQPKVNESSQPCNNINNSNNHKRTNITTTVTNNNNKNNINSNINENLKLNENSYNHEKASIESTAIPNNNPLIPPNKQEKLNQKKDVFIKGETFQGLTSSDRSQYTAPINGDEDRCRSKTNNLFMNSSTDTYDQNMCHSNNSQNTYQFSNQPANISVPVLRIAHVLVNVVVVEYPQQPAPVLYSIPPPTKSHPQPSNEACSYPSQISSRQQTQQSNNPLQRPTGSVQQKSSQAHHLWTTEEAKSDETYIYESKNQIGPVFCDNILYAIPITHGQGNLVLSNCQLCCIPQPLYIGQIVAHPQQQQQQQQCTVYSNNQDHIQSSDRDLLLPYNNCSSYLNSSNQFSDSSNNFAISYTNNSNSKSVQTENVFNDRLTGSSSTNTTVAATGERISLNQSYQTSNFHFDGGKGVDERFSEGIAASNESVDVFADQLRSLPFQMPHLVLPDAILPFPPLPSDSDSSGDMDDNDQDFI